MEKIKEGKVRDIYDVGNGKLVLVSSDRLSACDVVLPNNVPHKGVVLNLLSAFWFDYVKDIIPNHMISINNADMPKEFMAERCMLVKKLKMLPIECIVRGYITGSAWERYQNNETVCGIKLPDGLKMSEKLPVPIFTPTTKAKEGHDEHISFEQMTEIIGGKNGGRLAAQIKEKSIEIYSMCERYAKKRGIIIADTKLEFGIDENGDLVLADELLTPDSSRFWSAEEYVVGKPQKSYDREYLKGWLKNSGWDRKPPAPKIPEDVISITSSKYIEAFKMLTGINIC